MRLAALACLPAVLSSVAAEPPSPSQFLKFTLGEDRKLADYGQITAYFKALAAASPRVQIENLGPTTQGRDMIMAVISSEANLRAKAKYQEIARKLADPRGLSEAQVDALAKEGKAIVLVSCSIHASEIGATQMAMEWAHALATAKDAETLRRLDKVILLLVPSLNPDGQVMETEYYRKNLGTKYEGGRLPYLYHPYVGHDNNRDWYMLTQKESLAMNRAAYHTWHAPGLAGRAPDGRHRAAHVRAALLEPGGQGSASPRVADGGPAGHHHEPASGRTGQGGRLLRHDVRRLLARRHQEHRLVEERHRPVDRSRLRAPGHARDRGSDRTQRRRQRPGGVQGPDQFPQPLEGRRLAPAGHHGLRAHRVGRPAGSLREREGRPAAQPRPHGRRGRPGGGSRDLLPHSGPAGGSRSRARGWRIC